MQEQKIREMFEKEDEYWWFAARRSMIVKILRRYVKRGAKLLDAGCGTGLLTKTIGHTYAVTAVDSNPVSLRLTKQRKPKAKVLYANLEKPLPLAKASFDAVTVLDVLEHVDDTLALTHLKKVMKKGGMIIFTVPAYPWLFSYWDVLHQHKRRYTKSAMEKLLHRHGFSVVHWSYFNTMLFPFILLVRLVKSAIGSVRHTDCYDIPVRANSFFLKLFRRETAFAVTHSIPFGLSLLVIAKKK